MSIAGYKNGRNCILLQGRTAFITCLCCEQKWQFLISIKKLPTISNNLFPMFLLHLTFINDDKLFASQCTVWLEGEITLFVLPIYENEM